jgi:hypothetical protein
LFCSIWSLKTKFLDKTVNSFLLNSKKIKGKKKQPQTGQTDFGSAGQQRSARTPHRAAGSKRRGLKQQQPSPPSLFIFFLTGWTHLSSPISFQDVRSAREFCPPTPYSIDPIYPKTPDFVAPFPRNFTYK